MQKELHIWMKWNSILAKIDEKYLCLNDTLEALYLEKEIVHTTQIHICSTKWLEKGYRLFIHMLDDEIVEIVLGTSNKHTKRDIRTVHNLQRLLLSNEFGYAVEDFNYILGDSNGRNY
jgi:transcription elongation factor GreA-like protein